MNSIYKFGLAFLVLVGLIVWNPFEAKLDPNAPKPLLIGMEAAYPPYNWTQKTAANQAVPIVDSSDYANGYDVQVARKIGQALNRPVKVVKIEWDGLIPALMANKVDLIIAGMSPTSARKEVISFSQAYYDIRFALVMKQGSPYLKGHGLKDFAGARITGQIGTLHYNLIKQLQGAKRTQAMESFPVMRMGVKTGKTDAYITEESEAIAATMADPSLTYVILDDQFKVDPADKMISIGMEKDSPLQAQVNQVLSQITAEERQAMMTQAIKLQAQAAQ
ncbi:transporter substrate-binding domain-containing protein [Vaginisenegalia massiliensis]|uniref:transporter substrate-binding domain-containing protein n=1 Tax=Vaginisenegalia massiliensis TaxID=2058294 RepID=UPI0013DE4C03|nr:transporter substrate-binding domain-containing protein [Vaginisenegalia massiliensis]